VKKFINSNSKYIRPITILLILITIWVGAVGFFYNRKSLTNAFAGVFNLDMRSLSKSSSRLKIGTAVSASNLGLFSYTNLLNQNFNLVVPENDMKWRNVEKSKGVYNFDNADKIVDYATRNGMAIHGHTLLWYNSIPDWVEPYLNSLPEGERSEALKNILKDFINKIVGRYKGKIESWDVINEVITDDQKWAINPKVGYRGGGIFQKYLPDSNGNTIPDYIELAFQYAKNADPEAKLFYNDYNIEYLDAQKVNDLKEEKLALVNKKSQSAMDMVKSLIANKVPIDGVGIQSHIASNTVLDTNFEDQFSIQFYPLYRTMQAYQALGMELRISEMDVRVSSPFPEKPDPKDLQKQAATYANYLLSCKLIDSCTSFTVWQFSDNYVWYGNNFPGKKEDYHPNIFDRNWKPKPAYDAMLKVLEEN
jgi:endo-1,4-beta-xylanase